MTPRNPQAVVADVMHHMQSNPLTYGPLLVVTLAMVMMESGRAYLWYWLLALIMWAANSVSALTGCATAFVEMPVHELGWDWMAAGVAGCVVILALLAFSSSWVLSRSAKWMVSHFAAQWHPSLRALTVSDQSGGDAQSISAHNSPVPPIAGGSCEGGAEQDTHRVRSPILADVHGHPH